MESWFLEITEAVCQACGISELPNSCNANFYEDGSQAVGWHADDEPLFEATRQDALIISLSLGATRQFEVRPKDDPLDTTRVALRDGDLCTMEGLMQKHYLHRVPTERRISEARINLTWRWITAHDRDCPAALGRRGAGAALSIVAKRPLPSGGEGVVVDVERAKKRAKLEQFLEARGDRWPGAQRRTRQSSPRHDSPPRPEPQLSAEEFERRRRRTERFGPPAGENGGEGSTKAAALEVRRKSPRRSSSPLRSRSPRRASPRRASAATPAPLCESAEQEKRRLREERFKRGMASVVVASLSGLSASMLAHRAAETSDKGPAKAGTEGAHISEAERRRQRTDRFAAPASAAAAAAAAAVASTEECSKSSSSPSRASAAEPRPCGEAKRVADVGSVEVVVDTDEDRPMTNAERRQQRERRFRADAKADPKELGVANTEAPQVPLNELDKRRLREQRFKA